MKGSKQNEVQRVWLHHEKKIEVREMTMGSVVLTIAQGLIEKDKKDIEIRIVDTFMGEVEIYNGMDDFLCKNWNTNWRVNFYNACMMHDNRNDKDYLKVIIADEIEMMD